MWRWKNMNLSLDQWGIIVGIVSSILTFGTVCLSYFNLREMKKAREESSRPYVIVGYECDEKKFIHLYVRNIGLSPAKNIQVNIKNPIRIKDGTDARELLFKNSIKYLVPNQEIKTIVFPIWEVPEENGEYADNYVSIKYNDSTMRKEYEEESEINIASEISVLYFNKKTMDDLVEAIKKLK